MEVKIRWRQKDIQGREIILKQETYAEHIMGDHESADARLRANLEEQIKLTLQSPDAIIRDETGRRLYYNTVIIRNESLSAKIKILKVVVETDRHPHEVVTWTPLRKGDSIRNGAIEYARTNSIPVAEI